MLSVSIQDVNRGNLLKIDLSTLPFYPKEVITISNVPPGVRRGCHAHKVTEQLLVNVSGAITVTVKSIESEYQVNLEKSGDSLYLPALTWGEQVFKSMDSVLQVYSSEIYDPLDYISNFESLEIAWNDRIKKQLGQ
jgi:hypothetical protein